MLHFFRKYQKFFFLFTTIIIVTSFAFFGTYQSFSPGTFRGTAKDDRSYSEQIVDFLNTEPWMFSRKIFGVNFLNDGVVSKEFLETGMAGLMIKKYAGNLEPGLVELYEREKNYSLYKHPYQPFLTTESIWSIFAPEMSVKWEAFHKAQGKFQERLELYLAQRQFPPAFLSQVLHYQEQSNPQVPKDPRLVKEDLSLFGHHCLSDWFGSKFMECIADVIIQTADKARKLGFKVTKDEVLADLVSRSHETYRALKQNIDLPVEDGYGLFQLYLRNHNLSEAQALKIWEDVTLFRRLMHEVGDGVFVDSLPLSQFYQYAFENVTVEIFQVPKEFRLKSREDLKKLEAYLTAAGEKLSSPQSVPRAYAPIEKIEKRAPELVGKRYRLYVAEVSKESLQSKVSIKEMLDWECNAQNWTLLQNQFPELARQKEGAFEVLEALDSKTRKLIDVYARKKIVELHPEWVEQSVLSANLEEKRLFLNAFTREPLPGITDVEALIHVLDKQNETLNYTQDQRHFYRFLVQDRSETKEVLTFKEAMEKEGMLEKLAEHLDVESKIIAYENTLDKNDREYAHLLRLSEAIRAYIKDPQGFSNAPFFLQLPIEKKQKTITRSENSFIILDEAVALKHGEYSKVLTDAEEGPYVYRFIDNKVDTTFPMEKLIKSQELVSQEARCRYFEKLLNQI